MSVFRDDAFTHSGTQACSLCAQRACSPLSFGEVAGNAC